MFSLKKNSVGFSLVEALVMVFVASTCIFVVWRVYTLYIKISLANPAFFQAAFLAEEGIEAMKFLRDGNWINISGLTLDTDYMLNFDGTKWSTSTAPFLIDSKFDRRIRLASVERDITGDIVSTGTVDPGSRKLTVSVSWQRDGATTTKTIVTYLNDIFSDD